MLLKWEDWKEGLEEKPKTLMWVSCWDTLDSEEM